MNKKLKQISCLLMCLVMMFSMTTTSVSAAPKIKLSKSSATLYVGSTLSLKLNNATSKITWTSSKKSVATVSSKGKVTAKKAGTTVITAKSGGKSYTCKITVKNVTLSKTSTTLYVGQSETLKVNGSSIKSVSTKNSKVATISKSGKIAAKKAGTTTITIKAKNGKSYTCKVTVKNATLSLNTGNKTVTVGNSFTVKVSGNKSTATWKSSDTSVATVDKNGKVVAKKAGKTTITASANGGSKSFVLTVKAKTTTATTSPTATVKPPTATVKPTTQPTVAPTKTPAGSVQTDNPSQTTTPTSQPTTSPVQTAQPSVTTQPTTEPTVEPENCYEWVTFEEPTCSGIGIALYTCTKTGDVDYSMGIKEIPATGHNYSEWTVSVEATCTTSGQEKRTCEKCGTERTLIVAALGHSYGEFTVLKDWSHDHEAKSMDDVGLVEMHCEREGCSHVPTVDEYTSITYDMMIQQWGEEVTQLYVMPVEVQQEDGSIAIQEVYGVFLEEQAQELFELINEARVANGLDALELYQGGSFFTMLRAAECTIEFSHQRPNGTTALNNSVSNEVLRSETLTAGPLKASAALKNLLNSASHYAILMNKYNYSMAVGCFDGFIMRDGELTTSGRMWLQAFSQMTYTN